MNNSPAIARILSETFVREVAFEPELSSTNDLAITISATAQPQLPLLVWTTRQTQGRGRGTNTWQAGQGALTFSLLIDPTRYCDDLRPDYLPQISLWTGLGLRHALAELLPKATVQVKWPNDVYIHGRKAIGILIEQSANQKQWIVGVGINVNNTFLIESHSEDPELCQTAISLRDVSDGESFDTTEVLVRVLRHLEAAWKDFGERKKSLADAWHPHCYLTNKTITIRSGPHEQSGICRGIAANGALQLEVQGQIQSLHGGTVTSVGF